MNRLVHWVLRHRLLVAGFWVVVAVAGGVLAPTTSSRLSYDFALPGQPAYETNQQIVATYGAGGQNDPLLFVVRGPDAASATGALARQARAALPGTLVVTPADAGAQASLAPTDDLAVVVVYPPVLPGADPYAKATPVLQALAAKATTASDRVDVTGFDLISMGGGSGSRGVLPEVLLGALGALIVLALVFASLLAGVPLLVAAVSILGTFLCLLGLTELTDVSFVVEFLVALIGLGVAIDYSLLVVTRWREERSHGTDNDEAIVIAMTTAGRSVLFSGVTVAVSLAALVLVPVPFLRSIGLGGLLIPLLSVATTLTLVPALLSAVGPRLQWPRKTAGDPRSRFWARIAVGVLRHRWLTVIGSFAVLLALAIPALGLTLGSPQLTGLAQGSPAAQAADAAISAGVPAGVLRPTEVLVPLDKVTIAQGRLSGVPGVAAAVAPSGADWRRDGHALFQVWSQDDAASPAGRSTLTGIRRVATGDASVGGSPAEDADFVTAVYGNIEWIALAVIVVTFLLLARALRSLWLPVKALVLNAVSISAAYGVTVLIWQDGHGSHLLFGQDATGVITVWVPIAAFAFLFGLSMDYEVFILSRMREAYDAAGDPDGTDPAVVEGIAYTGRLVTSAALILFLAFVALSTVPTVDVKILATTLALGIAVDALVVRGLLAPALVGILGRANWTLPRPLARVLLLDRGGSH